MSISEQEVQRVQTIRALAAMIVPLFVVVMFAGCIIGTYHKPHPNGIEIAVVGPEASTAQVRGALDQAGRGAFVISRASTVEDATDDVMDRQIDAAFVPSADPAQPPTLYTAGAAGRLTATATQTLAHGVTAAGGQQLVVEDLRPLAPSDPFGLALFLFMIVLTVGSYLTATLLYSIAPELGPGRRYSIITGMAMLIPTLAYVVGGWGYGAYDGSFGTICAFVGVGALYALLVGLLARLFQVLMGPRALFVSLALFVFLNIPSLGATYTDTMLPSFWRFLNHFWLGAETVNAERSILYFDGDSVGNDLARLLAWAVLVVVLLGAVALKLDRRLRHVTPAAASTEPGAAVRSAARVET